MRAAANRNERESRSTKGTPTLLLDDSSSTSIEGGGKLTASASSLNEFFAGGAKLIEIESTSMAIAAVEDHPNNGNNNENCSRTSSATGHVCSPNGGGGDQRFLRCSRCSHPIYDKYIFKVFPHNKECVPGNEFCISFRCWTNVFTSTVCDVPNASKPLPLLATTKKARFIAKTI